MGSREVPEGYTVLREGKAAILQKGNDVFYNPAQVTLSGGKDVRACSQTVVAPPHQLPRPQLHGACRRAGGTHARTVLH